MPPVPPPPNAPQKVSQLVFLCLCGYHGENAWRINVRTYICTYIMYVNTGIFPDVNVRPCHVTVTCTNHKCMYLHSYIVSYDYHNVDRFHFILQHHRSSLYCIDMYIRCRCMPYYWLLIHCVCVYVCTHTPPWSLPFTVWLWLFRLHYLRSAQSDKT